MSKKVILDESGKFPHCIDGPAIIHSDGLSKEWFVLGRRHRLDGPAVQAYHVSKFGNINLIRQEWWVNGRLHKEDGPAVIAKDSRGNCPSIISKNQNITLGVPNHELIESHAWYRDGKLHREGGPAVKLTGSSGRVSEIWFINGRIHRKDGPAVTKKEKDYETNLWHYNGKMHRDGDLPAWIGGSTKHNTSFVKWFKNGNLHREGGPAELASGGYFAWYKDGKLHRDGGLPARFGPTYNEILWYEEGRLHRVDGPSTLKFLKTSFEVDWHNQGLPNRLEGPAIIRISRFGSNDKLHIGCYYYIDGKNTRPSDYLDKISTDSSTYLYSRYMASEEEGAKEDAKKYINIGIELKSKLMEESKEAFAKAGIPWVNELYIEAFSL